MARRAILSGQHLGHRQIAAHHQDLTSSLSLYFSSRSPDYAVRFVGYFATEVSGELTERLREVGLASSLTVLASIEAAFYVDYLQRCERRGKDSLSRAFRDIYKAKQQHPSLNDDIFEAWIRNLPAIRSVIGDLRSAFKLRHWLAHGRYLTRQFGRYDFSEVFELADRTFSSFPFHTFDQ